MKLQNYGANIIEVSDNGRGIQRTEHAAIAQKHWTSKIESFEDMEQVTSYGFRGEALSSLCAMSNLSVNTKCADDNECGWQLVFDSDGNLASSTAAARSQMGTTVVIQDLFAPLPVRYREFQRNLKREYAKCISMLQEYALIATHVRFYCINTVNNK